MDIKEYKLYFDPDEHRYTDDFGTEYTSVTTKIDEYADKFDTKKMAKICENIGKNPNHPKYEKYKGKTRHQLMAEWSAITKTSQIRGNERHNYLEDSINESNGYKKYIQSRLRKGRIYTILDVLNNDNFGEVNLEFFINTGIKDRFPKIYKLVEAFVVNGYKVYSEVCVFSPKHGIAGLIDLLLIKDDAFVIIDWKTNKDPITFKSGYWEKDKYGKRTKNFINTQQYFSPPIQHISQSNGAKYTLQLTSYDYLVEIHGLKHIKNIICHIRHEIYTEEDKETIKNNDLLGKEKVDLVPIDYWKSDYEAILRDSELHKKIKPGVNLFNQSEGVKLSW